MKYLISALFFCAFVLSGYAQRKQTLDYGWKFHRGSTMDAESMTFDDSKWRTLNVPHDFSMESQAVVNGTVQSTMKKSLAESNFVGPFTRFNQGDWDCGQTVGGEGWYRKTFELPVLGNASLDTFLALEEVNLQFDGVYNHALVWVNGKRAALNVYGYMPFKVNLNEILKNRENRYADNERKVTVVVKVLNEGLNSRWYAGSGIFRHVWLEMTDKVHLNEWDVFVDGSELVNKGKDASLKVFAKVFNEDASTAKGDLCVEIYDKEGNKVAEAQQEFTAPAKGAEGYSKDGVPVATEMEVKAPVLWSVNNPYLYTAKVFISKSGEEKDALSIPFGIRTIKFSAQDGFKLNGTPMKLRGGCVHHDNGLLGGVGVDAADIRRVQLLKQQGYNAVRCAHNLPTEAFLTACDSIGMLVIDEVFDQWEENKRKDDYSNFFTRDHNKDMALMVRRDRNHPSVIMWSIGNEIAQRADEPRGKEIALELNLIANQNDGTRPTTMAVNSFWDRPKFNWEDDSPRAFDNVEIAGYNYEWKHYEADHDSFPDRIIYGSESYPNEFAQNWNLVEKHPYVIGDFVWTAIDYLGEAGLACALERSDNNWFMFMSWPWYNAWCGDIDIVGDRKPQSYFRDVVVGRSKIDMAIRPSVPDGEHEFLSGWGWTAEERHWNWFDNGGKRYLPIELRPENYLTANLPSKIKHNVNAHRSDSLIVNVYSRESRVQLLINDSIMGEKDVNPETYTASFTVAYEPGAIKAQTVPQTKKAEPYTIEFVTALLPHKIVLTSDRTTISSSNSDAAYINICVQDEEGHLCSTAELPLQISASFTPSDDSSSETISSPLSLAGNLSATAPYLLYAGTGHPYDMYSFRSLTPTTFRGRALAIIQSQGRKGFVTLTVKCQGMEDQSFTVEMK